MAFKRALARREKRSGNVGVALSRYKKLESQLISARTRSKKLLDKTAETTMDIVHAGETAAVAFGFGYLQGATGSKYMTVSSVPTPVLFALAAHGAALIGVGRNAEDHLKAAGNGALAFYATAMGRGLALKRAQEKAQSPVQGEYLPDDYIEELF